MYQFGIIPDGLLVHLYPTTPFVATLSTPAGVWPAEYEVELRFPDADEPTSWVAELSTTYAQFSATVEQVAARRNGETVELLVNGFCWAAGEVRIHGR